MSAYSFLGGASAASRHTDSVQQTEQDERVASPEDARPDAPSPPGPGRCDVTPFGVHR